MNLLNTTFEKDINNVVKIINGNKLKSKTILITGGTGLIGKMLIFPLMKFNQENNANIKIITTTRNKKNALELFDDFKNSKLFSIIEQDITKKFDINQLPEKINYIIHAAANTSSKDMAHKPLKMIQSVFGGTKNILEVAKETKTEKFIYLSSMEVYGTTSSSDGVISEKFYGKIDLNSSRSSYPEAKRLAKLLVLSYGKEYGFETITLRPTQVIGSGVRYNDLRVFAEFTRQALENNKIVMKTERKTVRSYIYITDMITAILHCICCINESGIYNVSNEQITISIAEMAKIIAGIVGNVEIVIDSSNVRDRGYAPELQMTLSSDKLIKTGWKPEVNTEEMFNSLVQSFKEMRG